MPISISISISCARRKIRETLNNLILKSPQDWQTNVALPFVRITGTTVEWDEMRFDVRLLQRVPYEGISRMQTSLRRRHRDRVVRRGIGMMIESDFYAYATSLSNSQIYKVVEPRSDVWCLHAQDGAGPRPLQRPAHVDSVLRPGGAH